MLPVPKFLCGTRFSYLRAAFLMLGAALLASGAQAQVTVRSGDSSGVSSTDLFDVSRGTIVTSASAQNPGSDARSAIGYNNVGSADPLNTYFLDGRPAGTVDFINFTTASAVTVTGFNLFTYDDSYVTGNVNRGMTRFSFLASFDSGATYTSIASTAVRNSYTSAYGTSGIIINAAFAPITTQYFRIEATRYNTSAPDSRSLTR